MQSNHFYLIVTICFLFNCFISIQCRQPGLDDYREAVQHIINKSFTDTEAYNRLSYLCDTFGGRMCGSEGLNQAVDWSLSTMKSDLLDNAHTEPANIPHWVRGDESLQMIKPYTRTLAVTALGTSIATPKDGITAKIIVVRDYEELDEAARRGMVKGRIVVYNAPFTSYGRTVTYRSNGAVNAAKHGAVASLTRSVTPKSLYTLHTGLNSYDNSVEQIPTAAITVEDAEMLQRIQDRNQEIMLTLKLNVTNNAYVPGANVMSQITGTTKPDEIVVIGGHLDSWDLGTGAHDDGAGCLIAWGAVRVLQKLIVNNVIPPPSRTIRVVLFTAEEFGGMGGDAYFEAHGKENNVFAMESDTGAFKPRSLSFNGTNSALSIMNQIVDLMEPEISIDVVKGGTGADISPLTKSGVPGSGLQVSQFNAGENEYFYYHHSPADTFDKIDLETFNECVAVFASVTYVIADMQNNLPT